jgi:phage terminase large subunit-like protein
VYVRQACERQLTDLERRDFPYYFDAEAGEAICRYMERLPHVKGEWANRNELIRLEPWQAFKQSTIFGWKVAEDIVLGGDVVARADLRRFRTVYIEVPRKNAKSTTAAGTGLYMLGEDGEAGAEVYSSATTRDQAKIVFDVARQMAMRADLGISVRSHSLFKINTAAFFRALHAQGNTLDGLNIHCGINDEVHAWHKRAVYDVLETAMGARQQPLMYNITTAGDELEGIGFELRGYGIRVLSRVISDETFFCVIYTVDDDEREHWQQREVWRKANPNWGVSVYPWDVEALAKKAAEVPSQLNAFLTKRLNIWVNAATAWMDMIGWQRCFDSQMRMEDFRGLPCHAGIDLASKIDVNSLAVLFRVEREGKEHIYVFMRHWLPEAAINSDQFGVYDGWVRMGHMTKTAGNLIDTKIIERDIVAVSKEYALVDLGIDPGHNSTQIGVNVSQEGITVVDVRPTPLNFSEPMMWLEGWVKEGTLHTNCPVLTWMVSNVIAKRDHKDNLFPRKETVKRKIDGLIALLIAINRLKMGGSEEKAYTAFVM